MSPLSIYVVSLVILSVKVFFIEVMVFLAMHTKKLRAHEEGTGNCLVGAHEIDLEVYELRKPDW